MSTPPTPKTGAQRFTADVTLREGPTGGGAERTIIEAAPAFDPMRTMVESDTSRTIVEPSRSTDTPSTGEEWGEPAAAAPSADASANGGISLHPGAAFLSYRLVSPLKVASGEADLWRIEDPTTGVRRILKYYRYGIAPKAEITAAVRRLGTKDVVGILETGELGERHYEIQEYIEHGSLADLLKLGPLSPATARVVVAELTDALEHLHAVQILHRDLKPANILLRRRDPLDLVLTDFGISSLADLSLHLTTVNRTAAYGAPEALAGVVARASDWWSLGIIVVEILTGRHPFAGLTEQAINFQLISRGVPVPKSLPEEWRQLARGLLARDHFGRWGATQVREWLAGRGDTLALPAEMHGANLVDGLTTSGPRPYRFPETATCTPADLAVALTSDWGEAVKHFGRGLIIDWVRGELHDATLASSLLDIVHDDALDAEQKLSAALLALSPDLPLVFQGQVVTPDWLPAHTNVGRSLLRGSLPQWLRQLRGTAWMEELRTRRAATRAALKATGLELAPELTSALLLTDPARVALMAKEERRQFVGSNDPWLQQLLTQETLTHAEAIVLLSAERSLFITPQEKAELDRADARKKILAKFAAHRIPVDPVAFDRAYALPPDSLLREAHARRAAYLTSSNATLERLWKKTELTPSEALPIVVCDRSVLINGEDAAKLRRERERKETMTRLEKTGLDLDWALVERLLSSDAELSARVRERQRNYAHAQHDYLVLLLNRRDLSRDEALVFTTAREDYFLTGYQQGGRLIGNAWDSFKWSCRTHPYLVLGGVSTILAVGGFLVPGMLWVTIAIFVAILFLLFAMG